MSGAQKQKSKSAGGSELSERVLIVCDYLTLFNPYNSTQVFLYGRQLGVEIIYISQKFTKIAMTIREQANFWLLYSTFKRTVKYNIYLELGDSFEIAEEMYSYFSTLIKTKCEYIVYNRESETRSKLNDIWSVGQEIHKSKQNTQHKMESARQTIKYTEAKSKTYKADPAIVGLINS